jgi:hypothetical protein
VYHEFIKSLLGVVTVATIWQRLRDERGLDVSVASLRRYVRANLPQETRRSQVTVLRENPPPGQEAQTDYGGAVALINWLAVNGWVRRDVCGHRQRASSLKATPSRSWAGTSALSS